MTPGQGTVLMLMVVVFGVACVVGGIMVACTALIKQPTLDLALLRSVRARGAHLLVAAALTFLMLCACFARLEHL